MATAAGRGAPLFPLAERVNEQLTAEQVHPLEEEIHLFVNSSLCRSSCWLPERKVAPMEARMFLALRQETNCGMQVPALPVLWAQSYLRWWLLLPSPGGQVGHRQLQRALSGGVWLAGGCSHLARPGL